MKIIRYTNPENHRIIPIKDQDRDFLEEAAYQIDKKYAGTEYQDYTILSCVEFWLSDEIIEECLRLYGKPDAVFNHFYAKIDLNTDIPVFKTNYFFLIYSRQLLTCTIADSAAVKTLRPFNFMSNRKRINRHLMIKILEHFDLIGQAEYTWSAADSNFDLSVILNELDSIQASWTEQVRSAILSPIGISPRWVNSRPDSVISLVNIKTSNTEAWNQGLDSIFNNTAVGIISESVDYQNGIGFTEKSAFPLMGLNLPIWVGGKYQADEFEKLGFDVFSDIIDHSYQYCDTLIERCYRAIADNYKILSSLEIATKIRQTNMQRLLDNRNKLLKYFSDSDWQYQNIMDTLHQSPDVPPPVEYLCNQQIAPIFNKSRW